MAASWPVRQPAPTLDSRRNKGYIGLSRSNLFKLISMAILEYNEVTQGKYIVHEGAPYEVLSAHVFRKQQRKPVNATKLKNLMTGKVTEYSFHQSEKVEEAEIDTKEVK